MPRMLQEKIHKDTSKGPRETNMKTDEISNETIKAKIERLKIERKKLFYKTFNESEKASDINEREHIWLNYRLKAHEIDAIIRILVKEISNHPLSPIRNQFGK